MMNDPYNRLRRPPQTAPELLPQVQMQPAPQGMPMQYISGAGDEAGGGDMQQTGGDIGALLGQYLKKRQGASAADAKSAWEAGGSL